jgi:hypothetical protein
MKDATDVLGRSVKASPSASMPETVQSPRVRCPSSEWSSRRPRSNPTEGRRVWHGRCPRRSPPKKRVDGHLEPERGIEPRT